MQLYLETNELNLIANVLLEREGQLSASSGKTGPGTHPGFELKVCEELLARVLARDMEFDSDELEQLADILSSEKSAINDVVAHTENEIPDAVLQRKRAKLDRVLEKIDEVCAML